MISLLRQCRDGAENDSRFGHRMRGSGTFADLLAQRFRLRCARLGLNQGEAHTLRTDLFVPPQSPPRGTPASAAQRDLFADGQAAQ